MNFVANCISLSQLDVRELTRPSFNFRGSGTLVPLLRAHNVLRMTFDPTEKSGVSQAPPPPRTTYCHSAFLCRVKGHTQYVVRAEEGSLGTRLRETTWSVGIIVNAFYEATINSLLKMLIQQTIRKMNHQVNILFIGGNSPIYLCRN